MKISDIVLGIGASRFPQVAAWANEQAEFERAIYNISVITRTTSEHVKQVVNKHPFDVFLLQSALLQNNAVAWSFFMTDKE